MPGVQIEEGDFPVPDVVLNNSAHNAAGRIYYTVSLQGVKPGVNGSGGLARITFRGLQQGLSRVVMEQVVLSDPQSVEIEVRVEDGVVWVEEPHLAGCVESGCTGSALRV